MSDDEKLGEVVTPDFGSSRLDVKQRTLNECRHTRVIVDPKLRRVECRDCEEILDPIEVLVQYASKERQFQYRREALQKMADRVDKLAAEEKRIKARIRRAEKKVVKWKS